MDSGEKLEAIKETMARSDFGAKTDRASFIAELMDVQQGLETVGRPMELGLIRG
jgi:hypothetical protein